MNMRRTALLRKSEIHVDLRFHFHRFPLLKIWPIFPLLHGVDRRRHELRVPANDLQIFDVSVLADDRSQNHFPLDMRLFRCLRILRRYLFQDKRTEACASGGCSDCCANALPTADSARVGGAVTSPNAMGPATAANPAALSNNFRPKFSLCNMRSVMMLTILFLRSPPATPDMHASGDARQNSQTFRMPSA